eukprot:TRINITY_DN7216_c0_g1_i2.p1 TRINITY_DN7216_c0_g1~~TRINITY_DN7216_c0_g1_i2.p1  ORF type:complete len:1398 (-),score=312.91 TRINITY_DN7216_c0_g1_i2:290-4483(-)
MGKGRKGERNNGGEKIPAARAPEELPIYSHREAILRHIREHRVTHIQGETGCGKSTQVPKYIMEDAEEQRRLGKASGTTKIVVTQPRRMAAITLARRVASELDEEIGHTVGYKISGDSVSGKLCFATTGFLLQVLVNKPEEFGTYTHVILDEVHERSVDADLLTMLMKLLMQCYPEVRLIVMSATLQAKLFAEYFNFLEQEMLGTRNRRRGDNSLAVKPIFVGVRTFPVEEIFLDEIDDHFDVSGGFARRGMDKALRGFAGLSWAGKGGKKGKDKGKGKDAGPGTASGFKRLEPQITEGFDELCKELVQQMAREMCTLIVFLPGIADITSFYETLAPLDTSRAERRGGHDTWGDEEPSRFSSLRGDASSGVSLRIYPMHSLIPREEQEEVFNEPPRGVCHVVLASNIAESSLTLPSVCGIIDLAMRRSIQYDARRLMSCLVTTWCSQSSCKQRAGRAGRTMPGRAVRLVTRPFFQQQMVEFDPPEMLNAPLTKLYLQAKQLCYKLNALYNDGIIPEGVDMDLSTPTGLLGEVVQPPATTLVEAAITELADVGCIDRPTEDALITPLGYIAMALPCELRLCRLLYFGLMLRCEADAIAMVAGLTAADPFSTPSLLVLKDEREYVRKLERSFAARRKCDRGRYSEPLMLRDLFAEWIEAGAPRGPRAMGSFVRDYTVIPKKFEAMVTEAVDVCTRLVKLLRPNSHGHNAIQRLLATMRFNVDRREELVKANYPSNSEYAKLFSEDVTLLRGLLCAGFSDNLLLSLNPRWAPSGGKKKKEEQMADVMWKQGLDPAGTVVLLNPPQELRDYNMEENHQSLCQALCGDRAKRLHWDEKERLLFCDFRGPPARTVSRKRGKRGAYNPAEVDFAEEDGWTPDGVPVINDVCPQAHRLHQFGAGRWKFTVENPLAKNGDYYDDYEGYEEDWKGAATLELFKPLQPYLLTWEVLQFSPGSEGGGGKGGKKGAKKPMSVKAMPDWRNPLGFACHVVREGAPQQFLGVCASVQGLEAGGSAFVAGATVLGLNHLPLLLVTLDPRKWQLQLGYDPQSGEVRAIKIMHYEIVLPPGTLTSDVIWKVNDLRMKVLEAMTPWEQDEEEKYRRGRGRRGQDQYIWVGEIREEMDELLEEIWDTPDPVVKSKKMQWAAGAGDHVSEVLALLQPLLNVEEIEYFATTAVQKSAGNAGKQGASSSKASKQKQSGSGGGQSLKRQGVSAEDVKKVEKVLQYLRNNGEAKLSRICGSFYTSPKVLAKYPDLLELSKKGRNNEETVRLVGSSGGGGRSQQGSFAAQQSSGGGWRQQSSGRSYGAGAAAAMEARVNELCRQEGVSCEATDFDRVVKNWIKEFAARRGSEYIQEAFGHLAEWCARKERHEVKNWKGYIMVLLRNWEAERWPREPDDEDDDR